MLRVIYVVLCVAGMIGFGLLVRWGMHAVSEDAAIGYGAGVMSALVLLWLAQRIEGREKAQRDRA